MRLAARRNHKKPQFNLSVGAHLLRAGHSDQFSGDRRANTIHIFSAGRKSSNSFADRAFGPREHHLRGAPHTDSLAAHPKYLVI
jgi:hypothetical protein